MMIKRMKETKMKIQNIIKTYKKDLNRKNNFFKQTAIN